MTKEAEENSMITYNSKKVVTTLLFLVGFAFLVLGSVLTDHKNIDIIYLLVLLFFIVKYLLCCRK